MWFLYSYFYQFIRILSLAKVPQPVKIESLRGSNIFPTITYHFAIIRCGPRASLPTGSPMQPNTEQADLLQTIEDSLVSGPKRYCKETVCISSRLGLSAYHGNCASVAGGEKNGNWRLSHQPPHWPVVATTEHWLIPTRLCWLCAVALSDRRRNCSSILRP